MRSAEHNPAYFPPSAGQRCGENAPSSLQPTPGARRLSCASHMSCGIKGIPSPGRKWCPAQVMSDCSDHQCYPLRFERPVEKMGQDKLACRCLNWSVGKPCQGAHT